jgi:WD40 repeat protein
LCSDDPQDSVVIDLESGEELLDLGDRVVFRAAFNPDGALEGGRYLAVSNTEYLDLYDMATGDRLASLQIFPNPIRFDPTGRYMVTGTLFGEAKVYDLPELVDGGDPDEALVFDATVAPGVVPSYALTADGVLATGAFGASVIRLWDIHSGGLMVEVHTGIDDFAPPHLNFSPDGSYLLYPDAGNVLRKFHLDPDRLIALAKERVTRELTPDECRQHLDRDDC